MNTWKNYKNKEEFYKKVKEKFGDKFDLSKVNYINNKTKIIVVCPKHGEFSIMPQNFLKSQYGCPKCGNENSALKKKKRVPNAIDTKKFIEKAKSIHGDKYNYSKVEYVNNHTKICIICPKHGEFWQTPNNHLNGYGCKKCGREKVFETFSIGTENFIKRAKEIHGNRYDYSKVEYLGTLKKVCIICPTHGEFWQEPHNHLKGCGCPYCTNKFKNTLDFIEMAKKVHGDKYNYDECTYENAKTKVKIICPIHGEFWQAPFNHVQNHGCPKCVRQISKWEQEICDYLTMLGIECEQSNRTILDGKEIDIFLPQYNIGIECDGLRWHNELHKDKDYHLKKTEECKEHGIRLIHIFEDEWVNKGEILKSMLLNLFGKTKNKIYARKCELKEVLAKDARKFLDENHIQGYSNSKINYGLYYNGELVSLMTFGKPRINLGGKKEDGSYELVRFCNKTNTNVIGGASKLFKHFIGEYNPDEIVSYSDKRWSLGLLYRILGFHHDHDSKPNYFYVDGLTRLNRFGFRKSVLIKEGFNKDKTEHEIMLERGIYRIYDCGTMVWKWKS